MGKRKVSILKEAATSVAEISYFIEGKGMPLLVLVTRYNLQGLAHRL